jgi:hypothetical protein
MKVEKELLPYLTGLVFAGVFLLLTACDANRTKAPDVSHIKADVKISRFEKALFSIDTTQLAIVLTTTRKPIPGIQQRFFWRNPGLKKYANRAGRTRKLHQRLHLPSRCHSPL